MTTLYERIGEAGAIDAAVDKFYEKVLADERISHLFEGVDMRRQSRHQKQFLTYAFGGAPSYPGRSMRAAHKRLVEQHKLSDAHFDAVMENLGATLRELGLPDSLIVEAATIAESTRSDVLGKDSQ